MKSVKYKKYTHFVGIDVSSNKLDYVVMYGKTLITHNVIINTDIEIAKFISDLATIEGLQLGNTLFGFEQTGIYTNRLLMQLKRFKANIVMEDALQIRNSLGRIRGKYDKLDATRIANYLYKNSGDVR